MAIKLWPWPHSDRMMSHWWRGVQKKIITPRANGTDRAVPVPVQNSHKPVFVWLRCAALVYFDVLVAVQNSPSTSAELTSE